MLFLENSSDMIVAAKKMDIHRDTENTRVFSAVLRLGHHVNFELSKIPDILNEYGILVIIIKQTIQKRARRACKPEDEELYRSLLETRPDLVEFAKNN